MRASSVRNLQLTGFAEAFRHSCRAAFSLANGPDDADVRPHRQSEDWRSLMACGHRGIADRDPLLRECTMAAPRMTALEAYAQHGSVSYGAISPIRLKFILLGAQPEAGERPRVRQALLEMPGSYAFDLAAELGVSHRKLNERSFALLGEGLPQ